MTDMLNKALHCILSVAAVCSLVGCLDGSEGEDYPLDDAEVIAFSLSSDSVPQLDSIRFTIDQVNNLIYNHDSLRFGTVIKWKVIVNYSNAYGTSNLQSIIGTDSTWLATGDSLDVAQAPFTLKNFAYDGSKSKSYMFKLNIHQIDPDSTQYIRVASGENLAFLRNDDFRAITFNGRFWGFTFDGGTSVRTLVSTDGIAWQQAASGNLPADVRLADLKMSNGLVYASTWSGALIATDNPAGEWQKIETPHFVRAVTGYLLPGSNPPASQKSGLCVIFDINGQHIFGFRPEGGEWTTGTVLPDNFPVSAFASFSAEYVLKGRLTIIGGTDRANSPLNTVWSTQDGLYWAQLTGIEGGFPKMTRPAIFEYAGEYRIMSGLLVGAGFNRDMWFSADGGVTWSTKTEKTALPEDFNGRWAPQVVVSPDATCFYLLGGKTNSANQTVIYLPEIWKCYLNSMLFPKDE
jgi:hypothetical protein